MKGGESLGNEEGSEETSEEGSEEEVSPYQDLHAGGKATCSRRFFMPKNQSTRSPLGAGGSQAVASKRWGEQLDCERRSGAKQSERRARFWCGNHMFAGDERPFISLKEDLFDELRMHGVT